jgi:DNA-binding transcriptional regulator YiaG
MNENLSHMTPRPQSVALDVEFAHACVGMLTGAQIRAARALLGWSAQDLANRSGVSYSAVQRAEAADGVPSMRAPNLHTIQRSLEDGGVIFLTSGDNRPGGDGVRMRP